MKPLIHLCVIIFIAIFDLVRAGFYLVVRFLEVVSVAHQTLPAKYKKLQRVLAVAVILALMLHLTPLSLSASGKSVATLLYRAPPPFSKAAPYLQEVAAPLEPPVPRPSESLALPVYATGAEITQTAQSSVEHGASLAYTLTVANTSGSDWGLSTVYVTDTIPHDTKPPIIFWTEDPPWAASTKGNTIWYINPWSTITHGLESAVGNFYVTVDKPLADGTIITNSHYVVTTTMGDIASGAPVTTEVLAPAFTVQQTASPTVCAGANLDYTVFVSNTGRATMKGPFTVTTSLDEALALNAGSLSPDAASSGQAITWTLDLTLTSQTGITRTFQVTAPDYLKHGTILTNVYTATNPTEVTPDGSGQFGTPVCSVAASLETNSPVAYGQPLVFTNTSMGGFLRDDAYLWEYGDNTTSHNNRITHTHFYTDPLISIYAVTLTVTSKAGCGVMSVTQPVTVLLPTTRSTHLSNTAANDTWPITLTAIVSDSPGSQVPGAVHHFVSSPVPDPQTAGVAFGVVITAQDQYSDTVLTFNDTINLQDDTGALQPTSLVFTNGVTDSSRLVITRAQANVRITPVSGTIDIYPGNYFTVVHNLTDTLEIKPQNATVVAGQTVVYTVTARDEFGNPWDATSLATYTASGGGAFDPQPGGNTFSARTDGAHIITVTDPVSPAVWVTTTVKVTRGQAVSMTIFPRGATLTAGDTQVYTATVSDGLGNNWVVDLGEMSFNAGGGNVFLSPGNILSATRAGTWAVVGSHTTVVTLTDATTVTIIPSRTAKFIGFVVGPVVAGVAFPVVLTAMDAFGNPTPSFSGLTATITDSTTTIAPMVTGAFSETADWSGDATITTARTGNYITVTGFLTPGVRGVIGPFTVLPNRAATITVDVNPAVIPICSPAMVTATVRDAYGNLVPPTLATFTYSGTPQVVTIVPASGNTVNGQLRASLSSTQLGGPGHIQARTGAIVATSQAVTFTLSGNYSITLRSSATTIRLHESATLMATVRGCGSNPLPGQVITFTASQGSVPPVTSTSDASGLATATFNPTAPGAAIITGSINTVHDTIQINVQPDSYDVNLPLVLQDYQEHRPPDLVVRSIDFSPSTLTAGAPYNVIVTIANEGPSTVLEDFWVDLYLNPGTPPAPNQIWPDFCPGGSWSSGENCYGKAWHVTTDMPPGGTVTLSTSDPEQGRFSDWPPPAYSKTHSPFYVLVDSWGLAYGAVQEINENNNLVSKKATESTVIVPDGPREISGRDGGGPRPEID